MYLDRDKVVKFDSVVVDIVISPWYLFVDDITIPISSSNMQLEMSLLLR